MLMRVHMELCVHAEAKINAGDLPQYLSTSFLRL